MVPFRRPGLVQPLLGLLLAGLLSIAACGGGGAEEPRWQPGAPDDSPLEGQAWTGGGRRPALRGASPDASLRLEVPPGASRVVLHVTVLRDGWWPFRGTARARAEVELAPGGSAPEGTAAEGTELELPVAPAEEARWHRVVLPLPPEAVALRLSARPGRGDETWWSRPHFEGLAPPRARNVLLVSLDTLRADAVSHLGQSVETTPVLDALAEEGTTWSQAISPAPWTLPAHVSVMTGVLPSWHGRNERSAMDGELPRATLASILGGAGWDTAAITGEGSISWLLGATRGFDLILEHPHTPGGKHQWLRPTPECVIGAAAATAWLRERAAREASSPFFLFWHTYEPHHPYTDRRFRGVQAPLPPGIAEEARQDWLRYLGDIAAADASLGTLLRCLDELGLRESTDVIVFSDHGEEFGEHLGGQRGKGQRHGHGSWDTLLRVPLVASSPSIPRGRRDEQVTTVDVFPTVLAFAGLDGRGGHGRALQVPGGHEHVQAEGIVPGRAAEEKTWRSAEGWKHVTSLGPPFGERLHDLSADPLEMTDAAPENRERAERMRERSLRFFASAPPETALRGRPSSEVGGPLPKQLEESLRSLGYIE